MPERDVQFELDYRNRIADLEKIGFDGIRKLWVQGIQDVKAYSRYLAEKAADNFFQHGNITLCQMHLDDLSTTAKNFVRRAPFVAWLQDHYPIRLNVQTSKLELDRKVRDARSKEDWERLHAAAMAVPYWEYLPDTDMQMFTGGDVLKRLEGILKSFGNDKHLPKNDAARDFLAAAMAKIAELRRIVPIDVLVAATPASSAVHKQTTEAAATEAAAPTAPSVAARMAMSTAPLAETLAVPAAA